MSLYTLALAFTSSPPAPPSLTGRLYIGTDGVLYRQYADGVSVPVGTLTQSDLNAQLANYATTAYVSSTVDASMTAHTSAADPHPQYLTSADIGGPYEPAGTADATMSAHVAAIDPHPVYMTSAEGDARYDALNAASSSMSAHLAAADPHPVYLTQAEGDGRYDATGAASASMTAHTSAADAHPVYLTQAEGDARYDATGAASASMTAHTSAADPHPVYLTQAEGDARYPLVYPSRVRAYMSAASLALVASTFTTVPLDAEVNDSANEYNPSLFTWTPAVTGDYLIAARCTIAGGKTRIILELWVGDAGIHVRLADGNLNCVSTASVVHVTGGTAYKLKCWSDGASTTVNGGEHQTALYVRGPI